MPDRLFSDARLAALYDAFCPRDQRGDFDFYLPMVMAARSVLDVGCGTGAMLKEARDAGHSGRLCGLDPAAGMLKVARERSDIEWVQGDLHSVQWEREFDLVVMSGHAFQVFVTDEELREALRAIHSVLTGDGRFAFETRNPRVREWERWTPDYVMRAVHEGVEVEMVYDVVTPNESDLVSFRHIFTSPDWPQPETSHSTLRFLDTDTLSTFLSDAGLAIECQFGDWQGGPLTETAPEIITIARPA